MDKDTKIKKIQSMTDTEVFKKVVYYLDYPFKSDQGGVWFRKAKGVLDFDLPDVLTVLKYSKKEERFYNNNPRAFPVDASHFYGFYIDNEFINVIKKAEPESTILEISLKETYNAIINLKIGTGLISNALVYDNTGYVRLSFNDGDGLIFVTIEPFVILEGIPHNMGELKALDLNVIVEEKLPNIKLKWKA